MSRVRVRRRANLGRREATMVFQGEIQMIGPGQDDDDGEDYHDHQPEDPTDGDYGGE